MKRSILAVDVSYHTYRAAAAHQGLTHGQLFTGGIYGFLVSVAKLFTELAATDIVFCLDRKPYIRATEYPAYKNNRTSTTSEQLKARQRESLEHVLSFLQEEGLPIWGLPGFECDDLIAHLVHKYRHRFDWIYAATNDSDLYQLMFWDRFAMVHSSPVVQGISKVTRANLEAIGLTPEQYKLMTAMTGTHNGVEGIPKVGRVTAIRAINDPSLMRAMRGEWAQVIDRNLRLINLPHPDFDYNAPLPRFSPPGPFDRRSLYRNLDRWGISCTSGMLSMFERLYEQTR